MKLYQVSSSTHKIKVPVKFLIVFWLLSFISIDNASSQIHGDTPKETIIKTSEEITPPKENKENINTKNGTTTIRDGCITAYSKPNFEGEWWAFCPKEMLQPEPEHSKWKNNIHSFLLPIGHKAIICKDFKEGPNSTTLPGENCSEVLYNLNDVSTLGYGDDIAYIGPSKLNQSKDFFRMIFASDTQIFWKCQDPKCISEANNIQKPLVTTTAVHPFLLMIRDATDQFVIEFKQGLASNAFMARTWKS